MDEQAAHPRAPPVAAERSYAVGMLFKKKSSMVTPDEALRGRSEKMQVPLRHLVLGGPLKPPFPPGSEQAVFGMGCFWGAERMFWQADGVHTTAVGYAGGVAVKNRPRSDPTTGTATGRPASAITWARPVASSAARPDSWA